MERLRRMAATPRNSLVSTGIGDDCAILRPAAGFDLLVTTDLCIEDVHFRRAWHPPESVGHRCLTRGLSDIAAMGGEPVACFLSLALPASLPQAWVDGFLRGLLRLAHKFKVPLAGGDTAGAKNITADIMVLGRVPAEKALRRSGARSGDQVYLTGTVGGAGLVLKKLYGGERVSPFQQKTHFYPVPRLAIGRWLRERGLATAGIDLSDGISVDLAHLCQESKLSAVIDAASLPIAPGADLKLALHAGEDYELLFTAPPASRLPAKVLGVSIRRIGEMRPARRGAAVSLRDAQGKMVPLKAQGWQHFRKDLIAGL